MQEAESHPQCRRLQLRDLIISEMQRLTKYPLLLENIIKHTEGRALDARPGEAAAPWPRARSWHSPACDLSKSLDLSGPEGFILVFLQSVSEKTTIVMHFGSK